MELVAVARGQTLIDRDDTLVSCGDQASEPVRCAVAIRSMCAWAALKAIRGLYPIEDRILNNQEMAPATIEQIRREIAPW